MQDYPFFSVIIPVKNEAEILKKCLNSLLNLDYPKNRLEIIIADGLSTDNTKEVAESFGAKVVRNEKEVVVSGRNVGFEVAQGDLIAFTDADCTFSKFWLKNSLKYFQDPWVAGIGGPTILPEEATVFEKAVDCLFEIAELFSATSHRKNIDLFRETEDLPGCNAIYKREVLKKVMPVEENFLTAEDVWMNYCIKKIGYKFVYAGDVLVWHHRRSSPKKFLRQIYRFSIGRLQVGKRNSNLISKWHIIVGSGLLFLVGFFCFFWITIFLLFLFSLSKKKSFYFFLNFLLVVFIFLLGWSLGFWRELLFPLKDIKGR